MAEDAKVLLAHMEAEHGEYQIGKHRSGNDSLQPGENCEWHEIDTAAFLTRHNLSKEEIIAEYRERLELLETYRRQRSRELLALLRARHRPVKGWTERRVLEDFRGGQSDAHIGQMYMSHVRKEQESQ